MNAVDDTLAAAQTAALAPNAYVSGTAANFALRGATARAVSALSDAAAGDAAAVGTAGFAHPADVLAADAAAGILARDRAAYNEMRCVAAALVPR